MTHHHWLSLGFTFLSSLFILPYFTNSILFWSFWLFVGTYAFLDVGHARTFKAKPYHRGLDTALITSSTSRLHTTVSEGTRRLHNVREGTSSRLHTTVCEEFAKLFARDGFNVILVSPSSEGGDLKRIKKDLLDLNPLIKVHLILRDLEKDGAAQEIFHELCEDQEIQKNFRITHLINGAHIGYTGEFLDLPIDSQLDTMKTTRNGVVQLCHSFGNYFRLQKQRHPKQEYGILNMSSSAAFSPAPYFAVYQAINSFVHSFTIALHEELLPYRINVTSLCPGIAQTHWVSKGGTSSNSLVSQDSQPSVTAKIGYRALFTNRRYAIVGYVNYLYAFMLMLLPYWMISYVNQFIYTEKSTESEIIEKRTQFENIEKSIQSETIEKRTESENIEKRRESKRTESEMVNKNNAGNVVPAAVSSSS